MKRFRNDFTDQMVILVAILIPALIGSGIGGGGGFLVGLVVATPIFFLLVRYIEGEFPLVRGGKR